MKKSLLAVAVAAALPTFAQAQSSITLFGLLDASVEYSNAQANASVTGTQTGATPGSATGVISEGRSGLRVKNGVAYGSRFGIRGTEDLGGGLRAIFTLEHRLEIDTGDTSGGAGSSLQILAGNQKFWNGQAWVGLSGGWGQLTAGRQYTPIFWALIPADFSSYGYYNNWAAVTGNNVGTGGTGLTQGPFRLDNSLAYRSPTWGGLTVYAAYAPGENLQTASNATGSTAAGTGDVWGLAAGWQLGGLYLAAGYHSLDNKSRAAMLAADGTAASGGLVFTDVLAAAVSYKFSNFGVSLGYTDITLRTGVGNATEASIRNILGSAFANIGPGILILSVVQRDFSDFVSPGVTFRNDSGLNLGLAYRMPLSKRTDWYVAYGLDDISGVQTTAATTLIDSQSRFAIGVRHQF